MQRQSSRKRLAKAPAQSVDGGEGRPPRRRKTAVQLGEEREPLLSAHSTSELNGKVSQPLDAQEQSVASDLGLNAILSNINTNGHRSASDPNVVASIFPEGNGLDSSNGHQDTAQSQQPTQNDQPAQHAHLAEPGFARDAQDATRLASPVQDTEDAGARSQPPSGTMVGGSGAMLNGCLRRQTSRDDGECSRLASSTGIELQSNRRTSGSEGHCINGAGHHPTARTGSTGSIGRTGSTGSLSEMMEIAGNALRTSGEYPSIALLSTTGSFLQRTASSIVGLNEDARRTTSDPRVRLEKLLGKLNFEFTPEEEVVISRAFQCDSCHDVTTTCHQIRAVYDAFHLSWVGTHPELQEDAGPHMQEISLADLKSTIRKSDYGNDFHDSLAKSLKSVHGSCVNENTPFGAKDFMVCFAKATLDVPPHRRIRFNRSLGRMFGIEKTQQRFRLKKFAFAFFADNLAMFAHPICIIESLSARNKNRMMTLLTDATWLPLPYMNFEDFQIYLVKLWLPTLIALTTCVTNYNNMTNISIVEPVCPLLLYNLIGLIVSTISGFEHRGLVMRRKYVLTGESKQEDLRAIFAFRAHTPEGHAVERIGVIADVLCVKDFKAISYFLSRVMGLCHFLVPAINRAYVLECHGPLLYKVQFWLTGGHDFMHAVVTLPSAIISGYLVYRLMFITFDIFYNDLAFLFKLKLFRASTTSGYYLSYRRKWLRTIAKDGELMKKTKGWENGFMQFLTLQDNDDLLLWCRVRQLLMDSCCGFKNTQRDVIFTYMLIAQFILSFILVTNHYNSFLKPGEAERKQPITALDLWALLDCSVFSVVLVSIMYLKLALYDLRRSDIHLLHNEYYRASLARRDADRQHPHGRDVVPLLDDSDYGGGRSRRGSLPWSDSPLNAPAERDAPHASSSTPLDRGESFHQREDSGVAFGYGFSSTGPRKNSSRWEGGDGRRSKSAQNHNWPRDPLTNPRDHSVKLSELQVLLEETARHIQHFERPPTILGYPVTWEVLRYMSLSLVAAIITGLKGTIFRSLMG